MNERKMKQARMTVALPEIPQPRSIKKPRRILAIDYGRKRIGLALSDELQLIAQPLAVLTRTNRQNDIRRLREICRKHQVARIVVGHPIHLTGAVSEMAHEATRFAARLGKHLSIAVELVDERLTSWEAAQTRPASKLSDRLSRPIDDVAAALILRDYLEKKFHPPVARDSSEAH
jgi:putative holliday junction resolvase